MANTSPHASLVSQLWDKDLFVNMQRELWFANLGSAMMSEGTESIIQVKNALKKAKGDRITIGVGYKLTGDGVAGDDEMEGNEERKNTYYNTVLIDQIRNAERLTGRLSDQKASYDTREEARNDGKVWIAEFLEKQFFMKLGGVTEVDLTDVGSNIYSVRALWSNTTDVVPAAHQSAGTGARYICADTEGVDSLASTDILTTNLITRARVKAALSVAGQPRVRPIRVKGRTYYVMFVHPWQAADLKTAASSTWAQAQRDAQGRGDDNPIFTGSLGIWDGVILHESDFVPTCQSGSDFDSAGPNCGARAFRALLCGAQAAIMVNASKEGSGAVPTFMEEETFDFKNKTGYCVGYIGGIKKSTYNSIDYGVVSVDTGATDLS